MKRFANKLRPALVDGTLVIVDVQPGYTHDCRNRSLLAAVLAEIRDARARGWAIVVLEVEPWQFGETAEPVMYALEGYKRHTVRLKSEDDGSTQVLSACLQFGYSRNNFRVTGVYIDACVVKTAHSLAEKTADAFVRVVKRACSTNFDEQGAWKVFRNHPRIKVA